PIAQRSSFSRPKPSSLSRAKGFLLCPFIRKLRFSRKVLTMFPVQTVNHVSGPDRSSDATGGSRHLVGRKARKERRHGKEMAATMPQSKTIGGIGSFL